jgi:peroxiredoxin Q/BCP
MTKLSAGDPAPPFSLRSEHGTTLSVPETLSAGPIVLIFYPMDQTPGCTAQLCAARDAQDRYDAAGVRVFGVNDGSAASHQRFVSKHGLTATLLVDNGLAVSAKYNAVRSLGLVRFIKRTVVGIGTDGKIAFYERGAPSTEKILSAFAVPQSV